VVQIAGGDDASTHFLLTGAGASGSGVLRVNLASDDPAVAALETLDNFIETDRGAVNLIVGQAGVAGGAGAVSAATPRVTIATDDAAAVDVAAMRAALAGTLTVAFASAQEVTLSGAPSVTVSNTVPVSAATLPLPDGAAADATLVTRASETTAAGVLAALGLAPAKALTSTPVSASASGDNTLVAGAVGETARVHRLIMMPAGDVSAGIKAGATTLLEPMPLLANQGLVLEYSREPYFVGGDNEAIVLTLSAAVAVTGMIEYVRS
ncbi:MAG: hypothetical protein MI723_10720, partial [Caulobacterales bacterium]|nr:hypothetical protein [Caulobacterales bacterium]